MNVETSASPEGALENNECLAEKRSEEIAKQLSKDLDIDKDLITREWIDENWDAFLEELPASGLENVSDIRRIITSNDDLDARENELMMLPNYEEIYQIFQDLRNCQITIDYHTREYFDVETCINGKPYGTVVLGKDQPEISLQKSRQYYDENHSCVTANNMMVALMDAGRYEDALEYAEKISNDDICPVMANNKAVLFMYLDEPYLSASLFSLAKGVPMAKYNEGLMLLKNEEYKRSAELLNDYDESVNSVVANMYVENYDAAAKQSADSNRSASAHYLRAIAYAKDGSEALALGALRQTVSLDPAFKSIALNQAEFIPYRTNAEFIQLTK